MHFLALFRFLFLRYSPDRNNSVLFYYEKNHAPCRSTFSFFISLIYLSILLIHQWRAYSMSIDCLIIALVPIERNFSSRASRRWTHSLSHTHTSMFYFHSTDWCWLSQAIHWQTYEHTGANGIFAPYTRDSERPENIFTQHAACVALIRLIIHSKYVLTHLSVFFHIHCFISFLHLSLN